MSEQQNDNAVELNVHRVYTKDLTYIYNEKNIPTDGSPEEQAQATQVGFAVDVQVQDLQQDGLVDINVFLNLLIGRQEAPVVKFEIVQGAIFVCKGIPDDVKPQALYFDAAASLWPYIAHTLDKFLTRSGIPPIFLSVQDFRAVFQQTLAQRQQALAEQEAEAK